MRKRHLRERLDLIKAAIREAGSISGGARLIGMDRAQMHRELRMAGLSRTEILAEANQERRMPWPTTCPPNLRRRVEEVLSLRPHGPVELWGEMRDWLVEPGAEPPATLPEQRRGALPAPD